MSDDETTEDLSAGLSDAAREAIRQSSDPRLDAHLARMLSEPGAPAHGREAATLQHELEAARGEVDGARAEAERLRSEIARLVEEMGVVRTDLEVARARWDVQRRRIQMLDGLLATAVVIALVLLAIVLFR